MPNSSQNKAPVVIAAIALVALLGGAFLFKQKQPLTPTPAPSGGLSASPEPRIAPSVSPEASGEAVSPPAPKETLVYVKVDDEDGSHLKPVPAAADGGPKIDTPEAALNAMAKLKDSPLPKGTVANKAIIGKNGLAIVDFNDAFKTNFSGGDRGEGLVLSAITQTMGQFGAKQVQITVAGKKIDTLGGMETLSKPLSVAPPRSDSGAQDGSSANP